MKIIANHAHLMPPYQEGKSWRAGDMDMLLKHLDACEIERTVIFPPYAVQMDNDMMKANRWALQQARAHPDRIIPAGTVFPLAANILEVLQMLFDEGVRWLKIHPSIDVHDITDAGTEKFYARAEELGMIADYHTGPHNSPLSLIKPEKFDDLVWKYPKLRFVYEHVGGRTYFEDFSAILGNHPERTYGGLTTVYDKEKGYFWYIAPQRLEELIKGIGARQFIFGLDFPWNSIEDTQRHIQVIRSLGISVEDKDMILGGNLMRLLGG